MDDDFNTPQAIGVLFDLARLLNGAREQEVARAAFSAGLREFLALARVMGLLTTPARREEAWIEPELRARVESLVEQRRVARTLRNFAEADRLRTELAGLGVSLVDTPAGTTWKLLR